ncbi:hypothetical protein NEOLEDRAFT_1245132 [Neolentinus lepideus HHB14362 ss-1]|uniref:Uncharacterized protein n=1 Tax=Neolentinus lepideus HHB14362 ss-1 TaxID=1314782 RepID=A0A165P6A1_9AGAM|nr:hypothetical protein NEOLEDRAFT_1245132 [Neolentinus lepideus HHB14362 ss-1]
MHASSLGPDPNRLEITSQHPSVLLSSLRQGARSARAMWQPLRYINYLPASLKYTALFLELYVCCWLLRQWRLGYLRRRWRCRSGYRAVPTDPSRLEADGSEQRQPRPLSQRLATQIDGKASSETSGRGKQTGQNDASLSEKERKLEKVAAWLAQRPPLLEVNPGAIDIVVEGLDSPDEESGLRQPLNADVLRSKLLGVQAQTEVRATLEDGTNARGPPNATWVFSELTYRTPHDGRRYSVRCFNTKVNEAVDRTRRSDHVAIDFKQDPEAWLHSMPPHVHAAHAQARARANKVTSEVQEDGTEADEEREEQTELPTSNSDSSVEHTREFGDFEWVDPEVQGDLAVSRMWLSDF